ncbi:MAG TPA: hypothetical protein VGG69_06295 [Rhizomicrobium sp.]|jgi:hypothetical protein
MRKVQQFRRRARECRVAALRSSTGELRSHYENLAEVWEKLADERLAFFVENPEPDMDTETERKRASA